MEWFSSLDPALKVYWGIALAGSLVFVVQTIMTFIGMDGSDGMSADFDGGLDDGGPSNVFSFRNFVNFFLGYGWSAVCFYNTIHSPVWLNVVSIGIGLSFVGLFFLMLLQIMKLSTDKTFKMTDTVGRAADVYLVIPGEMKGRGKIQVSVGGAYHEIDAMTRGEKLPTGSKAKVVEIIDSQTLLVEAL